MISFQSRSTVGFGLAFGFETVATWRNRFAWPEDPGFVFFGIRYSVSLGSLPVPDPPGLDVF